MKWYQEAACLYADPDMFFPAKGAPATPAQRLCQRCPVTQQCLQYAIDNDMQHGVWGGVSERQRARMRPPRPRLQGRIDDGTHGTRANYVRGCRCDDCTDANRTYKRRWRQQQDAR